MLRTAAVVIILLAPAFSPPASGDAPERKPVVHEELTRVWDHVAGQLEQLGSLWREHFRADAGSAERPLITFMLRHREELGLSAEQVRSLERVRGEFQREAVRREADIRIGEMDLNTLLEAPPVDLDRVERKIREIERSKADIRLGRIRAIEQGRALLSSEQREKLNELVAAPRFSSRLHVKPSR